MKIVVPLPTFNFDKVRSKPRRSGSRVESLIDEAIQPTGGSLIARRKFPLLIEKLSYVENDCGEFAIRIVSPLKSFAPTEAVKFTSQAL